MKPNGGNGGRKGVISWTLYLVYWTYLSQLNTLRTHARYPLLFTYRDTLFGTGLLLEVQVVNGRALCVKEAEDEYWVYGVNPGGMAAHGPHA